jgi:hypothetical protein
MSTSGFMYHLQAMSLPHVALINCVVIVSGVGVMKRKKKIDGSLTQCQALSRNCL